MKKLTPFLLSAVLAFGAAACQNPDTAKTSSAAPNNANQVADTASPQATQSAQKDAQSQTRRDQLNADIRAREQRNDEFNNGKASDRSAASLASEVRSKLEANIPNGLLTVEAAKDGTVTVGGTVTNQQQLDKIKPLAHQIKGVTNVIVKATVNQPKT